MLVLVQVALVVVYRLKTSDTNRLSMTPLDEAAPELVFETSSGVRHDLSAETGPVVVHFWATWCPPCLDELPHLLEFAEQSDIRVLAVSVDPDWESIRACLNGQLPAAIVRAHSRDAVRPFGVGTLPETFVVGSDDTLRARFAGAQDWRSATLRRTIANIAK
ncbi:MAG: TlpA disulfide reductase family protein [Deltaproteobacteria bacterium]